MSASTRAIQRPMGQGSIFGAVAIGAAALLAVGAIAWGAANLTASKATTATTPLAAPAVIDHGGRLDQAAPGSILDKGSRGDLAPLGAAYVQGKAGNVTPRFDVVATTPLVGRGGTTPLNILDRNADGNVVVTHGRGNIPE